MYSARVTDHNGIALYLPFFKALVVDIRELGYEMHADFAYPYNADFFNKFQLPFKQLEDLGKIDGQT